MNTGNVLQIRSTAMLFVSCFCLVYFQLSASVYCETEQFGYSSGTGSSDQVGKESGTSSCGCDALKRDVVAIDGGEELSPHIEAPGEKYSKGANEDSVEHPGEEDIRSKVWSFCRIACTVLLFTVGYCDDYV